MKKTAILLGLFLMQSIIAQTSPRKLVWQDNFDGNKLDAKAWDFELGDGCPNVCGWGNHEKEFYTKDNYTVKGGFLTIHAKKEGDKYTSTKITTQTRKEFKYGRIEARAKLPLGHGIWPAFWMLGANIRQVGWPKSGEIDIMEYVGREPQMLYTTLHTQQNHGANASSKKTAIDALEEGFHIFAVDWSKDKMDFYIDHQIVYTFNPEPKNLDNWPFDQPFYIILNVAVGGDFGGPEVDDNIFPQDYIVDYVKVYQ